MDDRADIVRLIFYETASGIGKGSIAARLNDAGVPPFRGKNGWHASYVQKLLSSDAALGIYQPHTMDGGRRIPAGPPVPGYFPPIVDESLALKARAAIISRRQGAAGRKGTDFRNILTGIARCAACGGSMTYIGKGDAERYLACSSARRRRGCSHRTLFNFNEAERQFLDAAMQVDPKGRHTPAASRTQEELQRIRQDVIRQSGRLTKLLTSFESDSTDEVVAAVASARDRLRLARIEEGRLKDLLVVEEHGAGLPDLHAAIKELRDPELPSSGSPKFLVRARIAHAAKAAGFSAVFHEHQRRVELRCVGYEDAVWFSCSPMRNDPMRDPLGRFAKRAHDG